MATIHGQHEVEPRIIRPADLPRLQVRHRNAPVFCRPDTSGIRGGADVLILDTGRIDIEPMCHPAFVDQPLELPLRCRRSADIAGADEQDADAAVFGHVQ